VALIKTDYEEGRLLPTQAGHPQLATQLFLSPHDILKKKVRIFLYKLMKKDFENKWP
jgi:hypothetical protein